MFSLVPSVVALGTLAVLALRLARRHRLADTAAVRRALLIAVGCQAIHFTEEAWLGFHVAFPALFGLEPMPFPVFLGFNLGCLLLWIVAAGALSPARTWPAAAAWFLALAGVLNGIAHPAMALVTQDYFPGLATSLPVAVACWWLCRQLADRDAGAQSFPNSR